MNNNLNGQAEKFIDEINETLSKMTLEEKVGQMTQLTLDVISKGGNQYFSDEPYELSHKNISKLSSWVQLLLGLQS